MQNVLSIRGQAVLAETMCLRPLLAFDFDGTLAPTVSRPDDAHVSVALARRLDQLWLTIRVGRNDPGSHARYFLDGTAEVGILLHRMLACVAPQ